MSSEESRKALEYLIGKFPGLGSLLDDVEFSTRGGFRTWTFGLRFAIQVGYLF